MKYTPCLEVILKELNLSIPSFRMIYCTVFHCAAITILQYSDMPINAFHCIALHCRVLYRSDLVYMKVKSILLCKQGVLCKHEQTWPSTFLTVYDKSKALEGGERRESVEGKEVKVCDDS